MPPILPPAFDAATYRARNPALALLSDEAARADHAARGRAAGLVASPPAVREGLLALIGERSSVLEIGPFCQPLLTGPQVDYLDVLDAAGLRARAVELGLDPSFCPDVIHHVGALEQVSQRYGAVISSHAIEHQPDLIGHLRAIERVLEPDGALFLIVPDKRYCFDHFLPESSIAQVLEAHEQRRARHGLASVIEHGALVTHNDPARHWAGDHGDPAVDRTERVRLALKRYEEAGDGYVDVHAWQFTPDSLRGIVDTLAALGLIGLEIGEVYDTAYGRNEFCAVLTLSADARRRKRAGDLAVTVIQTADPDQYRPMLEATSLTARAFCRRWGHRYESYVGIKRGAWPWQASYNRIIQLAELKQRGFTGWVLHLDADAYVADLDFDLAAYLADKGAYGAIFSAAGASDAHWDVNDGVGLINLGHPQGRRLIDAWFAAFMDLSDARLAAAERWLTDGNDQELLHRILERDAPIAAATLIEGKTIINWPEARFVRQHLRTFTPGLEARTAAIVAEVALVMRRHGEPEPTPVADRWAARLAHPIGLRPPLAEATVPPPDPASAARAIAAYAAAPTEAAPLAAYQAPFAAALQAGDVGAVADELAALGRARVAQGILGGLRQHQRAADPLFAERLASWTHDKLVSLAEATGALPVELAEGGRWDENGRIEPAALFALIEAAVGIDLAPPRGIGGHRGIAVRDGIVLHLRMLDAIHAAWRLRQLAGRHALGDAMRVAELAPGAGLTAFYAARLGLRRYTLFDRPVMNAVQSHVLRDCPDARILPGDALATIEAGGLDLLFDTDGLPGMAAQAAGAALVQARRIGVSMLLSINQEAGLPGQTSVAELMAQAGGWRRATRHRHWLRQGYVEELWLADRPAGRLDGAAL